MSKMYKVRINQGEGKGELVELHTVRSDAAPVRIKAQAGARYQLFDTDTGYAPENIRADRKGQDLRVFFEGRSQPDLVIEAYYETVPPGFNALIGEAENGRFYEYVPESGVGTASVPALADTGLASGLALGGLEVSPAGAAVGTLVAAGFPWLGMAGAGAAVAAAAVGAGGGGDGGPGPADTTPPVVESAQLLADDDSGPKDHVTNDNTPRITGKTEANAAVTLTVHGKTYDGKADASGVFTIPVTEVLPDGNYTPMITVRDAAGNVSQPFAGIPFRVDTSAKQNGSEVDGNTAALPDIVSISEDTGARANDFQTRDNTLVFNGKVLGYVDNGAQVALLLRDSSDKIVDSTHAKPDLIDGLWQWRWDRTGLPPLADGRYTLEAALVDGAGNVLTDAVGKPRADTQSLVIDTDKAHNFEGSAGVGKQADPNAKAAIGLSAVAEDTGYSDKDFITRDNTLKFSGSLQGFEGAQGWVQVTLRQAQGTVLASEFLKSQQSSSDTAWEWDLSGRSLPDGQYQLDYALVDTAGNTLSSGSQAVLIDNSPKLNAGVADPNANLMLGQIALSEDTGKPGDLVTRDRTLTFSGTLGEAFTDNADRLRVQVVGQDGKVLSQQYLKPSGTNWSFENLTELGPLEGVRQYTVRASLVDAAGNTLKATDQSFMIDTMATVTEKSSVDKGASVWSYSVVNFSAAERGQYTFTVDGQGYSREYTGGLFDLKEVLGKTFAPGQFNLSFTDLSGNPYQLSNSAVSWDFSKAVMGSPDATMPVTLPEIHYGGTSVVGSVGKLVLDSAGGELDISSLYTQSPRVGDTAAINHIDARAGDHLLKLTMGDVLALGVKDSFSLATAHKGHVQLRIDGDAKDVLRLDDLVGNTPYSWDTNQSSVTLGGRNYRVFSNDELGLDLFVESEMRVEAS